MRALIILAAAAAFAAAPAAAHATLVYDRGVAHPAIWIAADDGSGAHRLAKPGSNPRISPDGSTVVYVRYMTHSPYRPDLMVVPADGSAPPRVLAKAWRDVYTFDWTEDSSTIVTVVGSELNAKRLVLIDVATGTQRTIARGWFYGASFSPADDQLVYARWSSDRYQRGDVFRVSVDGGKPTALTTDHKSLAPLWGPTDEIVFVRLVDAKHRKYGPKNELYLMTPDGSGVRRLTRTKVEPLLSGLSPTEWSADGDRLLTQFGGQDTSYAVTVNPSTGAQKPLLKAEESGLVGTRLSADGRTVLGATGGFDPGSHHDIVTVPYSGGAPTVLVRGGFDPDWTR